MQKNAKCIVKNFGEFFDNQIQYAGAIIMSRTDIASEKKVQESLELLRSLNKDAAIITTPIENLDGKKLVEVMEHPVSLEQEMLEEEHEHHHHHDGECGCGHDHHHHHADEVFTSWGKKHLRNIIRKKLDTILQKLSKDDSYGMILRSKGILQTEDGSWVQFDLVPGEYEIREGSADYTGRICVIGSKLKEDELEGLFF